MHSQQQVLQLAKSSPKEALEASFLVHWKLLFPKLPEPERQYPVRNPDTGRFWKLDFCWIGELICVEIQGGAWIKGGHNTALGQAKDYIRHNHLTRQGWRVLYFNTVQLKNMADAVTLVAEVLTNAKEVST